MKKAIQNTPPTKKNVLFVHYGDQWIRGSEICLLNLMNSLNRSFQPVLWTNNRSLHKQTICKGIPSYCEAFSTLLGWLSPKFNVKATVMLIKRTCNLIREHDIHIIHINSAAPSQWVSIAAYMTRTPFVTQLHCHYNVRDRTCLLLHLCPHIITVSKAISQGMISDGFPSSELSVIHNGVPESKSRGGEPPFSVHKRLSIPSHEPVLISVGSLIHRKGYDRLVKAIKTLHETKIKVHLLIIGDGPCYKEIYSLITKHKLREFVHLVGEQKNVSAWLMGGCDAFVSGARSEAFGLVLVEASLSKLPVIAPNVGGIPEVVTHNKTGIIYDSSQVETSLPAAITHILKNKECSQELVFNAYHHSRQHFSLSANTVAIESVYHSLLSKSLIIHQSRTKQALHALKVSLRPIGTFLQNRISKIIHYHKESVK